MMCWTSTSDTSSLSGSGIFFLSSARAEEGWGCSSSSSWQKKKKKGGQFATICKWLFALMQRELCSVPPPLLPPLLNHCPHCLNAVLPHICKTPNAFNPLLKNIGNNFTFSVTFLGRHDTDPGFISSQASSWPALGASTPVRIFPLSTWMTFTGRSLIWLVSSRGWGRRGNDKNTNSVKRC